MVFDVLLILGEKALCVFMTVGADIVCLVQSTLAGSYIDVFALVEELVTSWFSLRAAFDSMTWFEVDCRLWRRCGGDFGRKCTNFVAGLRAQNSGVMLLSFGGRWGCVKGHFRGIDVEII
jgi:hypothetical protein